MPTFGVAAEIPLQNGGRRPILQVLFLPPLNSDMGSAAIDD